MKTKNTTTTSNIQHDVGPPPDDYRLLPIVPDVTEILSEQVTYLRRNIVDGVYEDPQHYLDVSIDSSFIVFEVQFDFFIRFIFDFYVKILLLHYVTVFNNIYLVFKGKISMYVFMKMFVHLVHD
jgi:hypothetical protein